MSKKHRQPTHPEAEEGPDHPSQDTTGRHPLDAALRHVGFRIHSRPKRGEAVWEKGGTLFPESRAVLQLGERERADAKHLADVYFAGEGGE